MFLETFNSDPHSQLTNVDNVCKRSFDVVISLAALILLSPLFLIVLLIIKLATRAPALSRELRHGYLNEPIWIFKFRLTSAEQAEGASQFLIGFDQMLRRTNLTDVPKLLNVLIGDMSIVGPTLHLPHQDELFEVLSFRGQIVRPGFISWAQLNGPHGETNSTEETRRCIEYDLYYLDNWSLLFDLKIIWTAISKNAFYD